MSFSFAASEHGNSFIGESAVIKSIELFWWKSGIHAVIYLPLLGSRVFYFLV